MGQEKEQVREGTGREKERVRRRNGSGESNNICRTTFAENILQCETQRCELQIRVQGCKYCAIAPYATEEERLKDKYLCKQRTCATIFTPREKKNDVDHGILNLAGLRFLLAPDALRRPRPIVILVAANAENKSAIVGGFVPFGWRFSSSRHKGL